MLVSIGCTFFSLVSPFALLLPSTSDWLIIGALPYRQIRSLYVLFFFLGGGGGEEGWFFVLYNP